jgi:hypothetical protein
MATVGDSVTGTTSVQNATAKNQTAALTTTLIYPDGDRYTTSQKTVLKAGQTVTQSQTYLVTQLFPTGTYTLTFSATGPNGTSSATATITVV